VDFRIVDDKIGLDLDAKIRCSGEYSYRITNPILFYTNVTGNVGDVYRRGEIDTQTKSELITALRPALARISAKGIRPSELPLHEEELCQNLNEVLSSKWRDLRGIEMVSFTIPNTSIPEEYKEIMRTAQQRFQQQSVFANNPSMAAAALVQSQANAMETAAGNAGGAMMGFMGLNQAMNAGGMNAGNLFAMGQQQQQQQAPPPTAAPPANTWKCVCGADNPGRFCANCGAAKPEPPAAADSWKCACGVDSVGRFCSECGTPRPEAPASNDWTCACGVANTGRFCAECGKARG
jgi:membrane protease subunit (stomatin/prohibitin family)